MNFGTRIRTRRKALGWSQTRLEVESGISQQMLSKLERGIAFGTTEAIALARALKVAPKWLETGEGPINEPPGESITPDEREVLEDYRLLEPEKKRIARMTLHAMLPPLAGEMLAQAKNQNQKPPQDDEQRIA